MTPEPLVRARFCQEWLERMATQEEPWRSRFFAGVDPATRTTIDSASRVAWIPMAIHVRLADITHEAFGAVRAHEYYRNVFGAYVNGPVFGPLLRTGARIVGISVHTFVRWTARAWGAAFRDGGELVGEVLGPDRARLVYSGLPAVCTASDAWMISSQGSVYGAYDVLGVQGVVRVDMGRRNEGGMVLELEWIPPR